MNPKSESVFNKIKEFQETEPKDYYQAKDLSKAFDATENHGSIQGITERDINIALQFLVGKGFIEEILKTLSTKGVDTFKITQKGFDAFDDEPIQVKSNQFNFHGDVQNSALAVDNSKATVNIHASQAIQNLVQKIQQSPDFSPEEKDT